MVLHWSKLTMIFVAWLLFVYFGTPGLRGSTARSGPDLHMWRPQGNLCVESLTTSKKYYLRSRKYYYQETLLAS